jgi:hypothetical protein
MEIRAIREITNAMQVYGALKRPRLFGDIQRAAQEIHDRA